VFVTSIEVELPTIFVLVTGQVESVVTTTTVVMLSAGCEVVTAEVTAEEVGELTEEVGGV